MNSPSIHRVLLPRTLACMLLLVAACDAGAPLVPVLGPVHSHNASHPALPWAGNLTGTSALSSSEPACGEVADHLATATLELTGTLSHLGRVTWTSTDCTSLATFPEINFTNGTGVITAAIGDELHFTFSGNALVTAEGVAVFTGEAAITGGTGRFTDATGAFDFAGTVGLTDSAVTLQIRGALAYDASAG